MTNQHHTGQATDTLTLTGPALDRGELVRARRERLEGALAQEAFDAFLAVAPANVDYTIGYRSVAGAVHGTSTLGALVAPGLTVVAGPAADAPSVIELGVREQDFVAHGRFFFESIEPSPLTAIADAHAGFVPALATAVRQAGLGRAQEVERLRAAAGVTEHAIHTAIDVAAVGMSETELQLVVATELARGGVTPRFVVVTAGPRSAYSDTPASPDQRLRRGDLLRFDVGGLFDGYWSDLGRTAVVGEPNDTQRRRYDAILQGEQVQLDLARPGVPAGAVFDVAVEEVERHGLAPYRRHHCGHGIGLDVYEAPIIAPAGEQVLKKGMVFCFETPYYELGWGGMMVEDTLVITEDGVELLSVSDRSLRVIEP
jgi:Xaa-Pro aminopeptidase